MTDHDALCRYYGGRVSTSDETCSDCSFIAKVQNRERERIAQAIEAQLPGKSEWTTRTMQACARIARQGGQ